MMGSNPSSVCLRGMGAQGPLPLTLLFGENYITLRMFLCPSMLTEAILALYLTPQSLPHALNHNEGGPGSLCPNCTCLEG